jgi:1-acyl-sn-glycerol-3-phosphate acyltransferase
MNVWQATTELPPRLRPLLQPLLWPLAWLVLQLQLAVLGLASLAWNGAALLLYPLLPRATGRRIGRAFIAHGYRWYWRFTGAVGMLRLDAGALDALRDERGLVIVANHPSLLDAVMLVARLPRAACIMKASLMRNPLFGPGARLARYVRNDSAYGMVQLAVKDLQQGGQLVLFPEGTRTTRSPINPLHASFAIIAKRAQVPVQVVFIDTNTPFLGKGWPLWKLPALPMQFTVRLGPRFAPGDDHQALLAQVQASLAAGTRPPPQAQQPAR